MERSFNSVIVGLGEIGKGLFSVLCNSYDIATIELDTKADKYPESCSILNICIPHDDKFVETVNNYIGIFEPKVTIVHSTVPVGTTKQLNGLAVHSPVMAKHPNIAKGLRSYTKFIGYNDEKSRQLVADYLGLKMKVCLLENSDTTELMKLLSLTRYGLYLQVADEMEKACKQFGLDYKLVVTLWELAYNEGISKSSPEMRRPLYTPPRGTIGGHCVLQNMRKLYEQFDSKVLASFLKKYTGI